MPGIICEIARIGDFFVLESSNGCGFNNSPPDYMIFHKGKDGLSNMSEPDFKRRHGININEFVKMRLEKRSDLVKDIQLKNNQSVWITPSKEIEDDSSLEAWAKAVLQELKLLIRN